MKKYFFLFTIYIFTLSHISHAQCPDVSNVNFGPCLMIIGYSWNGSDCQQFGGCGQIEWVEGGANYSDYFSYTYDGCMEICDVVDIVGLVNLILNQIPPSTENLLSCDINSDGMLNVEDSVQIINIIL